MLDLSTMRAHLPIQLHHFLGLTTVRTLVPATYRADFVDMAALILDLDTFADVFSHDRRRGERTRILEVMVMVSKTVCGRLEEWEVFFEEHVGLRCRSLG